MFEREVVEETSEEQIEKMAQSDTFMFVPEETDKEMMQDFRQAETLGDVQKILYDRQFVDEEGNSFPIFEDDSIEPYCNHTFVSGTGFDHIKNSSGGCEIIEFKAQRCSKCGYVLQGEWISTITFAKCPH